MGQGAKPSSATPKSDFCEEKYRLQEQLLQAVEELLTLHRRQADALSRGDRDFSRFDPLIHMINEKKRQAKYQLMAHVEAHGC